MAYIFPTGRLSGVNINNVRRLIIVSLIIIIFLKEIQRIKVSILTNKDVDSKATLLYKDYCSGAMVLLSGSSGRVVGEHIAFQTSASSIPGWSLHFWVSRLRLY